MLAPAVRTFGRGGIHPDPHKQATAGRPIEDLPAPAEVRLPLLQHLGDPAVPAVKKGDLVRRGQKIAEAQGTGVPLHATISGKVKPIDRHPHPTLVLAQAIVIARVADAELPPLEFPEDPEWRALPRDEMLARIREAGIVGLGGATFPTWRKLQLPPGVEVDVLVINGAECEPYLTSDYRTMLAEPRAILEGAVLMARILGVREVAIGVESDKPDAARVLRAAAAALPAAGVAVHVDLVQTRYPQGAERQLVFALTGRTVPAKALPSAVGVVVQNVATAAAVHDAVRFRKPLLDRIVTVTGPGVREPRNVRVPLGTLLSDLVNFCGGATDDATRIVAGGPMMGRALPRLDIPVTKGLNGLVLLTGKGPFEDGYGPCIQCGRCIEVCPLGLEPDQVSVRVEAGKVLDTAPYGAEECYECGSCTFVCPSQRPLVQFMQVAKASLRRQRETRSAR
ncbi:MAG: electron transport complex subunit RsxC [Candidatus Eisenbacteria bacterium]|nr:electron transport complex subunit RsxC [Candidatus Eisenbacteria bacterium]